MLPERSSFEAFQSAVTTECLARVSQMPGSVRDQRFVVLDKPAGLPVHPGPRGGDD